jgi:hypothetical protein
VKDLGVDGRMVTKMDLMVIGRRLDSSRPGQGLLFASVNMIISLYLP